MGRAARDAELRVLRPMGAIVQQEIGVQGRRFRLRGRSGDPVPLSASTPREQLRRSERVLIVRGTPPGFWKIVQDGRRGGYIVAGRSQQGSTQRVIGSISRGGRRIGRGQVSVERRFIRGDLMNDTNPIFSRPELGKKKGYRQFAWVRKGHGRIGDPWNTAMRLANPRAARKFREIQSRDMLTAWRTAGR